MLPHTFLLEDAVDPTVKNELKQSAEHLVRIELPEIDLDERSHRLVGIFDNTTGEWIRHRIERSSVDGRCLMIRLKREADGLSWSNDVEAEWKDLSSELYRWII